MRIRLALLTALLTVAPPAEAASHQRVLIIAPEPGWEGVRLWRSACGRHGIIPEVVPRLKDASADSNVRLVVDVMDRTRLPEALRAELGALTSDEAYCVDAAASPGLTTVNIWGRTPRGVTAGAAWLLTQASWSQGQLVIPNLHATREPFFRGREATLCPTGRILRDKPELAQRVNYELWDEAHLREYPPFLRVCGFNSIQIMELIGDERSPGYRDGGDRRKIAPVLHTLADEAHKLGMSVSQYIWGSADKLHWVSPAERPARERRYLELAATYGNDVDRIVTHWKDEGYEGGYVVPQEATTFLWNAYQKYNPKVSAYFDVWGNPDFWKGDSQARGFLDATFSPVKIGVALERWYDTDLAQRIRNAGRPVGIWGWYLGDYEMSYGSHLETRVLDKYFGSLPKESSRQIDWVSIEMCFHALPSAINLYVAGQKMWNPYRPVHEIIGEYCRSVYGIENAEAMSLVYETVEEGQKDVKTYGFFIPQSDRFPDVRRTDTYQAKARKALAALKSVHLPTDWQPSFPVVGSPTQDIDDLRTELEQILQQKKP